MVDWPPTDCRGPMTLNLITIDSGCYRIGLTSSYFIDGHIGHFPGAGICLATTTLLRVDNLHINKTNKEVSPILGVSLGSIFMLMDGVADFVGDINIYRLSVGGIRGDRAIVGDENLNSLVAKNLSANNNVAFNPSPVHITYGSAETTHAHLLGLDFGGPFFQSGSVDSNGSGPYVAGIRGSCLVA